MRETTAFAIIVVAAFLALWIVIAMILRRSVFPVVPMAAQRRFPPPWSVDDADTKLGQDWLHRPRRQWPHALAYVYFEDEPG